MLGLAGVANRAGSRTTDLRDVVSCAANKVGRFRWWRLSLGTEVFWEMW